MGRLRAVAADERAAFLIAGAFNTAFGFAAFVALRLALGGGVHYLVVLLLAHIIGVLEAFTLYRVRVFKVRGNLLIDLLRFESVSLAALGANAAMLPLLVEIGGLPVIFAQLVALFVVAAGTYLAHKYFSFRRQGRAWHEGELADGVHRSAGIPECPVHRAGGRLGAGPDVHGLRADHRRSQLG